MKKINIWTDGSVNLNKKAGYAFVILNQNDEMISEDFGKIDPPYTAPHAELQSFIRSVNCLTEILGHEQCSLKDFNIEFFSDSEYVVKSLTVWGKTRSLEDWKKKQYSSLLVPLYEFVTKNNCKVTHVSAHSGIYWNEYVDKQAKKGKDL